MGENHANGMENYSPMAEKVIDLDPPADLCDKIEKASTSIEEKYHLKDLLEEYLRMNLVDNPYVLANIYIDLKALTKNTSFALGRYLVDQYMYKYKGLFDKLEGAYSDITFKIQKVLSSNLQTFVQTCKGRRKGIPPRLLSCGKRPYQPPKKKAKIDVSPYYDDIELPTDLYTRSLILDHPIFKLGIVKDQPWLFYIGMLGKYLLPPDFAILNADLDVKPKPKYFPSYKLCKSKLFNAYELTFNPPICSQVEGPQLPGGLFQNLLPVPQVKLFINRATGLNLYEEYWPLNSRKILKQSSLLAPNTVVRNDVLNFDDKSYFVIGDKLTIFVTNRGNASLQFFATTPHYHLPKVAVDEKGGEMVEALINAHASDSDTIDREHEMQIYFSVKEKTPQNNT